MKKFLPLLSLLFSSCSVVMAANRGGTDVKSIQDTRSRADILALGLSPTDTITNEEGQRVETFVIRKEHGSIARAFMHGLLDLSTAFIWEVAGTPIEATLNEKSYYSVKVTFDNQDKIQKMELF
ncbi:MAG: hypothetical protein KGJ02_01525 [Verrucomicrobiota bacterium]|nr:hypothetical protein [Verrucomicrobiota bacterium]